MHLDRKQLGDAFEQRRDPQGGDGLPVLALRAGTVEAGDVADHVAGERHLIGHIGEGSQMVLLQTRWGHDTWLNTELETSKSARSSAAGGEAPPPVDRPSRAPPADLAPRPRPVPRLKPRRRVGRTVRPRPSNRGAAVPSARAAPDLFSTPVTVAFSASASMSTSASLSKALATSTRGRSKACPAPRITASRRPGFGRTTSSDAPGKGSADSQDSGGDTGIRR